LFLSLFFFAFAKEKYALSSIFLGIAIAFKLYPAVFLVLFIKNKCYKECIYCVIFVVILTIAALFTFPEGLIKSTNMWLNAFVEINKIMAFSHDFYHTNTLFFLVQIAVYLYSIIRGHSTEAQYTSHLNHSVIYYYILAILMFTFLAFFTLKYEKTYWKQVTVLFFCGMLFPTISVEYKLIILFIPIFLFIKQSVIDKHQSIIFNKIYLLLFSLLLIPKNYLIFNFYLDEKIPIISGISPLFNIFIMLFFIFLIIYERIKIIQIEKTSH
jgi:hypothetical protein